MPRTTRPVWPAQLLLNAVAVGIIGLAFRRERWSAAAIWGLLGALWAWTGIAYHLLYFTSINRAAFGFAFLCMLQGALLVWTARGRVGFAPSMNASGVIGGLLIVYALVLYPVIGYLGGHRYPASPTFGAPCPTTIFTFGVLLWAARAPKHLLIIPAIWALFGISAVVNFGVVEDVMLPVAALVTVGLMLRRPSKPIAVRLSERRA